MRTRRLPWLAALSFLVFVTPAHSIVEDWSNGHWPFAWPAGWHNLEYLRPSTHLYGVHDGTEENVYEIPFANREAFEKAWPLFLAIRTHGTPIILSKITPEPARRFLPWNNVKPVVRIYAPSGGYVGDTGHDTAKFAELVAARKVLRALPPWPKELISPTGDLPEFLIDKTVDGKLKWVDAASEPSHERFQFRARIDLEIVIDGNIIDLNRIALPGDARMDDRRFK